MVIRKKSSLIKNADFLIIKKQKCYYLHKSAISCYLGIITTGEIAKILKYCLNHNKEIVLIDYLECEKEIRDEIDKYK